MTYLEELDCDCSFLKEWKTIQSSPKECFQLRSYSQALWWREEKTIREIQIVKRSGYIFYMIIFSHTLHYTTQQEVAGRTSWSEEKAIKKAEQAKEEKLRIKEQQKETVSGD